MEKVLIADDDFLQRMMIVDFLGGKYSYDIVANGTEVIEAYNIALRRKAPYDVMLLDISMPGLNGMEILKLIRQHEEEAGVMLGDGVAIIMITGHKEAWMEAFNSGCDDYIIKPISRDVLLKKIEEKISRKNTKPRITS